MTNRDREAHEQPLPTVEHSLQSCSTKKLRQRTRTLQSSFYSSASQKRAAYGLAQTLSKACGLAQTEITALIYLTFFEEIISSIVF